MKKILIVLFSLIVISCGSTKLLIPMESDVTSLSSKYPAITLAELNEGKTHFETQCGTCHGLKNPIKRTEEQWKKIVPEMAAKAKKKQGKEVIDVSTQESITKYLIAMRTTRGK